jgi:hypothetical protein
MAAALDHFTTWDDPRLWDAVRDLVTTSKRNVFIHNGEAHLRAAHTAPGEAVDITSLLNSSGIPTSEAQVLATFSQDTNTVNVIVKKAGIDWHGAVTLTLQE